MSAGSTPRRKRGGRLHYAPPSVPTTSLSAADWGLLTGERFEMQRRLIAVIRRFLSCFGFELQRKRTSKHTAWTPLEGVLHGLLSAKTQLSVVEIGANDGKWKDPIHRFLRQEMGSTQVLLIEPQPEIARMLAETYRDHEAVEIFEGAVASVSGELTLYRVRPDLWDLTKMPYMKSAPSHAAPSGFASTVRAHVEDHVRMMRWRSNGRPVPIADSIEALRVEALTVKDLVKRFPRFFPVDVLQVDVEGIDDQLVLAALELDEPPLVINFEAKHLQEARRADLESRLQDCGYRLTRVGADLLAVRAATGDS